MRVISPSSALWLVFFVNGAVLSSWAPRIPAVAGALSLDDGELGIALFGVAAGSVPALLATGRVLRRVSPATACRVCGVWFAAALPLIALANSLLALTLALVVLGAASGGLDVAMNTAGVRLERDSAPRRVLSRLHGGYSVGVLAGATAGAAAAAAGISVLVHFVLVSVVLLAIMVFAMGALPAATAMDERPAHEAGRRRLPRTSLLVLAVGALFLEGTITDWSALFLARDLGAGTAHGAVVVTAFTLAMAVSRTWGDRLRIAFGVRTIAIAGSVIAIVALAGAAAQREPVVFVVAVTIAGIGLGPLFPITISAAGETARGDLGTATAAVTAVGYLAYLAGPPLVGVTANTFGLSTTLIAGAVVAGTAMTLASRRGFSSHNEVDSGNNRVHTQGRNT
ncbi:putative MFS family arabinose efflux permease [Herbihabitans rhizosphaerae]|uniref:Putative MFS family arabinose efflux permease n=1 Tax=Herbihabitans rhizosphaerae TaxID=1872711 RepID=A0A4Q7KEX6_9PSEU|nr:MFS transporter [Herbihabitans rhizosphaerae]RZS32443.1 putative MFS family arabinose efflux permease [Herbihabitans rhizosphaerae]